HGIAGDAHAGSGHRQVSLLGAEIVAKLQPRVEEKLLPGAFAENILTEGLCLYAQHTIPYSSPRLFFRQDSFHSSKLPTHTFKF
ncbi:MAG: hypothetical protein J5803_04550, partial [Desulfovibrio sp.]|nr:hypothetical protein [Desulfovibrio sp.]